MCVGQRVACVDGDFPAWVAQIYKQLPIKDEIYTIRAVCMRREDPQNSEMATVALLLKEILNPPDPSHVGKDELAFKSERFVPLEELQAQSSTDLGLPALKPQKFQPQEA